MPFDFQPCLKGNIVELRPLQEDDLSALYAVASDPLIWEQHPVKTRSTQSGFKQFFEESLASGGALVVLDASNGEIIGSSRYHGYDAERSEVEIGWSYLSRAYWGGRYNGEMKRLMLEHAFKFVNSVVFLIGPENLRSRRAVEKIGGVLQGQGVNAGGDESLVYAISAELFNKDHQ